MEEAAEQPIYERLIHAGMDADDVRRIAEEAVVAYDGNRKPKGARSGAIGLIGCYLYRHLAEKSERFTDYRSFTVERIAAETRQSSGAVGRALNRLIDHGFIAKRRVGRGFQFRLLVPAQALVEAYQKCSSFERGSFAYDCERPLLERALDLLGIEQREAV